MRSALQGLERWGGRPPEWKAGMLYFLHRWDLPFADELLNSSVSRVDSSDMCSCSPGELTRSIGHGWDGHVPALSRMRVIARSLRDTADTVAGDSRMPRLAGSKAIDGGTAATRRRP